LRYKVLAPGEAAGVNDNSCALVVMAKAPRPGKVKTRLSPPLTPEQASELNICFIRDTTENIQHVTQTSNSSGLVAYTPVGDEAAFDGLLPSAFQLLPQRGEGFGERLLFVCEDLFAAGFGAVCLIDSDSPTMPQHALLQAVESLSLEGDRMVLGASDDGGYSCLASSSCTLDCSSRSTGVRSGCSTRHSNGRRKLDFRRNCYRPGMTWTMLPRLNGWSGNLLARKRQATMPRTHASFSAACASTLSARVAHADAAVTGDQHCACVVGTRDGGP
jgi:glycosyltransferase A (GT-A) superfamily protein (DUF2064 family)